VAYPAYPGRLITHFRLGPRLRKCTTIPSRPPQRLRDVHRDKFTILTQMKFEALDVLFCRKYTIINNQSAQVKWLLFILYSFLEQCWETHHPQLFLDAFSKFRKANVSFIISVCLPVCTPVCLWFRPPTSYNSTPTG
jgi:hypothetical protein